MICLNTQQTNLPRECMCRLVNRYKRNCTLAAKLKMDFRKLQKFANNYARTHSRNFMLILESPHSSLTMFMMMI